MRPIRIDQIVDADGEVTVSDLPVKRGQHVEVIVLSHDSRSTDAPPLTVGQLRQSALVGLWKDRDDIQSSDVYVRELRAAPHHQPEVL